MTWSNSVVVHVDCEEEREAAFHIPLTTIIANSTVQSKRKFTLASARHASLRNITRARIASRGTNTRNEKQWVDKKYLAAKKVHSLLFTQCVLFRSLTILSIKASMNCPAMAAV